MFFLMEKIEILRVQEHFIRYQVLICQFWKFEIFEKQFFVKFGDFTYNLAFVSEFDIFCQIFTHLAKLSKENYKIWHFSSNFGKFFQA